MRLEMMIEEAINPSESGEYLINEINKLINDLKTEELTKETITPVKLKEGWYERLFDVFADHGLTLTQSEITDIIHEVHGVSYKQK